MKEIAGVVALSGPTKNWAWQSELYSFGTISITKARSEIEIIVVLVVIIDINLTRQVSSMIHLARPTFSPVANIVFT